MLCQRYLADMNARDTSSQTAGKPHQHLEGERLSASSAEASVDVTLRRHTRPYVCTFTLLFFATVFFLFICDMQF